MKLNKIVKCVGVSALCSVASFIAPVSIDSASQALGYKTFLVSEAQAQAKKKKTRSLPGLSEKVLKQLAKVTEAVSPDPEKFPDRKPDWQEGIKLLQKMERSCKDKCNKYELSQIHRFYGFIYASIEDYDKAIIAYQNIVAQAPEIPVATELESLYYLSQLTYSQDKFNDSIKWLNKWIALSGEFGREVGADIYFLRSTINYSKDDKRAALKDVTKAISIVEGRDKVAKENWYGLQRAIYLEKEDYKNGLTVLEKLVRHYPKKSYWTQLSGVYGLLERDKDQLHTLDTVNLMGGLKKRQEVVNLAYLYLGEEVPYKAAKILEKGMSDKIVERNVKYLKVLASAWRSAKLPKKAIVALQSAAKAAVTEAKADKDKKSEEGNIHSQLAGLYLDIDDSKKAIESGKRALKAGNLKMPGEVHTNMGIAYYDLQQYKSAVSAFEKAMNDKQFRKFAENWLKAAKQELFRQEQLAKS